LRCIPGPGELCQRTNIQRWRLDRQWCEFVPEINAGDSVFIGGNLCPIQIHVGRRADIYVAFEIGPTIYFLNDSNALIIYDSNNLMPYRFNVPLTDSIALSLFSGVIGEAIAEVKLYVAYVVDGEFQLDAQPINFTVNPATSITPLSVLPEQDTVVPSSRAEIKIHFDRALDASSVDDNTLSVFGRWSGVLSGALSLGEDKRSLRFLPDRDLFAGEQVFVTMAAGELSAIDGSEFPGGYSWSYWVESATAPMAFEKIGVVSTRSPGSQTQIQTYGAYAGDLNQDGWSDFIVPNELSNDLRVFLNDGAGGYGNFSIIPIEGAVKPSPNEGADFDGDGDIDFAVGSAWGHHVHVFLGDGSGALSQTQNLFVGERVRGVCLADFENDGDPDIIATSYIGNLVALFTNDGAGNFSDAVTFDAGDGEWSCASADMNADGLTDITIGTRNSNELIVLLSNGDGSFTESGRIPAAGDPWMLAAGDVDRDGSVDIVAVNANSISLTVSMGMGNGELATPVSYSLAVDLGDLDGDGDLDAVTSDFRTQLFLIYENQGDGTFLRLPNQLTAIGAASCAILHDRDNDSDLDITGIVEVADELILFRH